MIFQAFAILIALHGQSANNGSSQSKLDSLGREFLQSNPTAAAVYAFIERDGKVLAMTAQGLADRQKGRGATADDALRIGSNTKVVTSTLLGLLVERGSIKWDTTVGEAFPELASTGHDNPALKAKLWELLCHHGGINVQDVNAKILHGLRGKQWRAAYTTMALHDPQNPGPGTSSIYGPGPIIAVAMVERLTGKTYESLFSECLGGPLGIESFAMGLGANTPKGYVIQGQNVLEAPAEWNAYIANDPSGGACLSLKDLAKIYATRAGSRVAIANGTFALRATTLQVLNTAPYASQDGAALGLYYEQEDGYKWLGHAGNTGCGDWSKVSISRSDKTVCFFHINTNRAGNEKSLEYLDFGKSLRRLATGP